MLNSDSGLSPDYHIADNRFEDFNSPLLLSATQYEEVISGSNFSLAVLAESEM